MKFTYHIALDLTCMVCAALSVGIASLGYMIVMGWIG